MFPKEIARIIGGYVAEVYLLDWIPLDEAMDSNYIYANPNAYRAGLITFDNPKPRHLAYIVTNPEAVDHIKANYHLYTDLKHKWQNPGLIDFLIASHGSKVNEFCGEYLMRNTNKMAYDLIMQQGYSDLYFGRWKYDRHTNPNAIDWIRAQCIDNLCNGVFGNPAAMDIIQSKTYINYDWLSGNPHPWAIEKMRVFYQTHPIRRDFYNNPGIFGERTVSDYVAILSA